MRFPIEQELRYRTFNHGTSEVGSGRTTNISSSGVLFTAERTLAVGEHVEVAIAWPARLDNGCALKLVVTGRVVRSGGTCVAIAIQNYEFRTRGVAYGL